MEVKIVIPSHKRADRVLTTSVVADPIICVPESQLIEYHERNPGVELVAHPDTVVGLTAKRQWIYEHFGNVFMLDDDVVALKKVFDDGRSITNKQMVREIIQATANAARQAGAFLFGFGKNPNPASFRSLKPISLTGYVTGCATGLLSGSRLWYNPKIRCNEDYWISCLNAYYHRIIWRDERFTFIQKDTFTNPGGLAEFRNMEAEKKDFEYLKECFGDVIQLKTDTSHRKRRHQFEKAIKLPF